ncbi:MAG: hypothetical protein NVSMB18_27900 [Acetobacteraceae bacterium]
MSNWDQVAGALEGVLERRWYTNHGPKAQALELWCESRFAFRHAIAVTNPSIGLILLAEAQGLSGQVLLSISAPRFCAQALRWAGLQAEFVGRGPPDLAPPHAASALIATADIDTSAAASWAAACGLAFFQIGTWTKPGPALIELPSIADDAGLACVLTDDDGLAARLRNIRSSYGAGAPVTVARTVNGRASEVQAAIALMLLEEHGFDALPCPLSRAPDPT